MGDKKECAGLRNGVVLLLTLSVIVAMLATIGVLFAYLEKSKNEAYSVAAFVQANLLFRDGQQSIAQLLKNSAQDKELKNEMLETLYFAPITMQDEENKERFISIDCTALNSGVNINWLEYENNSSEEAQSLYRLARTLFDRLAEEHNIKNSAALLSKIKSDIFAQEETQAFLEQTKGIISLSQLQKIARDYRFEEDDAGIEEIAWEKYFSFDQKSLSIDAGFLSPELISLLFEIELDVVQNDWVEGDDLQAFIEKNGGDLSLFQEKIFKTEPSERMKCRINYGYQNGVYAMGFEYLEGKAGKFEFYGKQ